MEYLLEDITVIDAASYLAGPGAATILADYGANVIKIEPPEGDGYRLLKGPYPVPYHWQLTSRNKRSLALDLAQPSGRTVLHRLVERADVITTNFLEPALRKYEMEYERLKSINPRLIFAHLSGYGLEGPDVARRAFDITGWWARTGMMELVRDPGQIPVGPAPGMGDHSTATALFGSIMTGLYRRERTGEGSFVSTSLLANGAWANGMALQGTIAGVDLAAARQRPGFQSPYTACYQCADGRFIVLCALNMPREWPAICRAINRAEWLEDEERAHYKYPLRNKDTVIAEIGDAFLDCTHDEMTARLDAEDVTYGIVPTMRDVIDDEQLRANDIIVETGDPGDDYPLTVNSPINLAEEPKRPPQRAPQIGQNSTEVLAEFGFSPEEIHGLLDSGTVHQGLLAED